MNIQAAKDLVQRYRSITKEDFDDGDLSDNLKRLTGFGSMFTCSLCIAARKESVSILTACEYCIYYEQGVSNIYSHCACGKAKKTYNRIEEADTVPKLLRAFKARAKYIESVIARIEHDRAS
jgi:hypothetical protein